MGSMWSCGPCAVASLPRGRGLASRPRPRRPAARALSNPGSGHFQVSPHPRPGLPMPGRCPLSRRRPGPRRPSGAQLLLAHCLALPHLLRLVLPGPARPCALPQSLHPLAPGTTRPARSSGPGPFSGRSRGTRPKPQQRAPHGTRGGRCSALGPVVGLAVVSDSLISCMLCLQKTNVLKAKRSQDVALEKAWAPRPRCDGRSCGAWEPQQALTSSSVPHPGSGVGGKPSHTQLGGTALATRALCVHRGPPVPVSVCPRVCLPYAPVSVCP